MNAPATGKVQTVQGPIEPDALGVTMSLDHVLMDLSGFREPPVEASARDQYFATASQETIASMRYYGMRNFELLRLGNVASSIEETLLYKQWGGNALVDGASLGLGRDAAGLARVSRATGLHVVMGSSYYAVRSHPPGMDDRSEDDIVGEIVRDVTEGVSGTGIRAGLIGEMGLTSPAADNELKVLRASGRAQKATGAPLMIHPGEADRAPLERLEVLAKLGLDFSRIVMAHVAGRSDETLMEIAGSGCFMQFDGFGTSPRGASPYALTYRGTNEDPRRSLSVGEPSDSTRLERIARLISEGFGNRLLLASDLNTSNRLTERGGHGYHFILANVVPGMRSLGFEETAIRAMLVENPGTVLTMAAPRSDW